MTVTMVDQLRQVGLVDNSAEPHLTQKGREWLRALEHAGARDQSDRDVTEAAAELVLSTNGLFR